MEEEFLGVDTDTDTDTDSQDSGSLCQQASGCLYHKTTVTTAELWTRWLSWDNNFLYRLGPPGPTVQSFDCMSNMLSKLQARSQSECKRTTDFINVRMRACVHA